MPSVPTIASVVESASAAQAAPRAWLRLALPVLAAVGCCLIILAAGRLASVVPPAWQGSWTDHIAARQPHFVDRFFAFDAVWYQRIADGGYTWSPALPALKQDVAFFPLWPLLLRGIAAILPATLAPWGAVACAACFVIASVCAFHLLAQRLLPHRAAITATLLFALYPGASFLLLSYPTGLMNLLCILALLALMDGKIIAAACYSGLVTAIGPLGLGTALTVCVVAASRHAASVARGQPAGTMFRGVVKLAGIGVLSVAGLAAFILWQVYQFGDPFAFIKAQAAWQVPLPWAKRILPAMAQLLIVPDFAAAVWELRHAAHAATLMALQASLEKSLHLAAEGMALIGVLASWRLCCRPVFLQGAFTMALFIWFHSTSRPGNSTLRLTYCVIGMFCGLAWLLRNRPRLAGVAIAASACMLFAGAFLTAAGYHVV